MHVRQIAVTAVVAGAMAAGGLSTASPAWAASTPHGCGLFSNATGQVNNSVTGSGGRGNDCSNVVNVAVALYKDISFFPDTREASDYDTDVANISRTLSATCDGNDPYYISTNASDGGSVEGVHTTHC